MPENLTSNACYLNSLANGVSNTYPTWNTMQFRVKSTQTTVNCVVYRSPQKSHICGDPFSSYPRGETQPESADESQRKTVSLSSKDKPSVRLNAKCVSYSF